MSAFPFPGDWIPDTQFFGNSEFMCDSSGRIWIVSNSTQSGIAIFMSESFGATFTLVQTINFPSPLPFSFDPAVTMNYEANCLTFIGQMAEGSEIKVVLYRYDMVANVVHGPINIMQTGTIPSDYDIIMLSNGGYYAVIGLMNETTNQLLGYVLDNNGFVQGQNNIIIESEYEGDLYSSVTLMSQDFMNVEIYMTSRPKVFDFAPVTFNIWYALRSETGTLTNPVIIGSYEGMYAGPLTVIPSSFNQGNFSECLYQGYYTQQGNSLIGNLYILNRANVNDPWIPTSVLGPPSLTSPVITMYEGGTSPTLAVIKGSPGPNQSYPVSVYTVNSDWTFSPLADFNPPANANWIRGSKFPLPYQMPWAFVGQDYTGAARFYTGAVLPPNVVVTPATIQGTRGVPVNISAAQSTSEGFSSPLSFSWSSNSSEAITLTANGDTATLLAPLSIGPAEQQVVVTVTVTATGGLQPSASGTCTVTYPQVSPVVIAPMSPITAGRNATVTITPTITVGPYSNPTYEWYQTGGSTVALIGPTDGPTLTLSTAGALTSGETLTFMLVANDGINSPVAQTFSVNVTPRVVGPTTNTLCGYAYGNILGRNTVQTTTPLAYDNALLGPIIGAKEGAIEGRILICSAGVHVIDSSVWCAYPLLTTDVVLDAYYGFLEQVLILTTDYIYKVEPKLVDGAYVDTDNVSGTIVLTNLTPNSYTTITSTAPYNGYRILTLTGPDGLLLLRVDSNLTVVDSLVLGQDHLYGSTNVAWVRLLNVQDLHSGIILIGTTGPGCYETVYSLATRGVVNVYDASDLINQQVSTGEILNPTPDSYSGFPMPPVLSFTTPPLLLSWTQTHRDQVTGYTISLYGNGNLLQTFAVPNGKITSFLVPYTCMPGITYTMNMVALSGNGNSAPSNTITLPLI